MQQERRRVSAVRAAVLALMCVVPWVASGCGSAGDDAVAQGEPFSSSRPAGRRSSPTTRPRTVRGSLTSPALTW